MTFGLRTGLAGGGRGRFGCLAPEVLEYDPGQQQELDEICWLGTTTKKLFVSISVPSKRSLEARTSILHLLEDFTRT